MSEKISQESEPVKSKKEKQYEEIENRFKEAADSKGYGIERGIFDVVVGLNAIGINTNQSCEGHIDSGRITPWIDVNAPDQPKEYVNEDKIYQEIADKYGISVNEIFIGFEATEVNEKALLEVQEKLEKSGKTKEYEDWNKKNKELWRKTKDILKDFYKEKAVKLALSKRWIDGFTIYNGGKDYWSADKKRTEKQKEELGKRLMRYRKEFKVFAEFLKRKFFEE